MSKLFSVTNNYLVFAIILQLFDFSHKEYIHNKYFALVNNFYTMHRKYIQL